MRFGAVELRLAADPRICYPAMGERAITVSRSPYLGALPMWFPAVLAIGMPGIMGITPPGGALRGVAPSAEARGLVGGARAVQLAGTDNGPIDAA